MKYFTNNEMKEIAVKFMKSLTARAKSPTSRSRNACRIGFEHERTL